MRYIRDFFEKEILAVKLPKYWVPAGICLVIITLFIISVSQTSYENTQHLSFQPNIYHKTPVASLSSATSMYSTADVASLYGSRPSTPATFNLNDILFSYTACNNEATYKITIESFHQQIKIKKKQDKDLFVNNRHPFKHTSNKNKGRLNYIAPEIISYDLYAYLGRYNSYLEQYYTYH